MWAEGEDMFVAEVETGSVLKNTNLFWEERAPASADQGPKEFRKRKALESRAQLQGCLQKIMFEKATGIMIVPLWRMQTWFTRLLDLLVDAPRWVRVNPSVLLHPLKDQHHSAMPANLQTIREIVNGIGLPADVKDTIMCSWRQSTHKQYEGHIRRWRQFCFQRQINFLHPSLVDVLVYLQTLFSDGLSYSSLNTAKAALSCCMTNYQSGTSCPIMWHVLVTRYMKGVFNLRRPVPRYSATWDVNIVLNFISSMHPLATLPLKFLSFKLVMLMALTSGQRCQTLAGLDTQVMQKTADSFSFVITNLNKQDRPAKVIQSINFLKYDREKLCVWRTLEAYLERTHPLRSNSKLLISYIRPFKSVGTSTIGRWLKTLLGLDGIDTTLYTAHSTRAASASKASKSVPVDIILNHVGWASATTFRAYYNKPIIGENQYDVAVLE